MATRCFALAMLVITFTLVLGNLPAGISSAPSPSPAPHYRGDPVAIKRECDKLGAPSMECCKEMKDADIPSLCKYFYFPLTMEKATQISKACGIYPPPKGLKCNTVPPSPPPHPVA